jgi:hypothetical protein
MGDTFEDLFQKALAAVQAAEAGTLKLDVRGTCQACFRQFVVKRTTGSSKYTSVPGNEVGKIGMVLHGFQRPGYGYLEGMCWGAGRPPYELSCELTKAWYKNLVEVKMPSLRDFLERLVTGRHKSFTVALRRAEAREMGFSEDSLVPPTVIAVEGDPLPPILQKRALSDQPNFDSLRKRKIMDVELEIEGLRKFIKFLLDKINDWRYAPDKFIQRKTHPSELSGKAWFDHPGVRKLMHELPAPEALGPKPAKSFFDWAMAFPNTLAWTSMGGRGRTPSYYKAVRKAFDKMPAVQKAGLAQDVKAKPEVPPERQAKEDHVAAVFKTLIEDPKLVAYLKSVHKDSERFSHSVAYGRSGKPTVAGEATLHDEFLRRFKKAGEHDTHGNRMFSLKRVTGDLKDLARDRQIKIKLPKAG